MKKLLVLTLFLACQLQAEPMLVIDNLSAGKVDLYDATRIPDNSVFDCRNTFFDGAYPAEKRKGMSKLNTTAVGAGDEVLSQFEYKQSDGDIYHIVQSSMTIYYRQSGANFTAFISNFSSANPANYAIFMDTLTVVNGINNMQSWDTSTVFTQESTYQPEFIITWQNRLWIAGDTDERSKVRACEWLDPSDYTLPASPVYTDPAVFDINSQDGQKVKGFFLSPNGNLGILKERSVWEIGGYDRSDFYLRLVITDIGCVDQKSVVYKENVALWLSEQGIVGYDGQTIRILSNNISATIDDIQQLQVGAGAFSKDAQGDWEVYSSTDNIDTTTKVGSIELYNQFIGNTGHRISNLQRNSTNYFHFCYDRIPQTSIKEDYFKDGVFTVNKTIDTGTDLFFNASMTNNFVMDSNDNKHLLYWSGSEFNVMYASASFSSAWSTSTIKTDTVGTVTDTTISIDLDSSGYPHIIFSSEPANGVTFALYYSSYSTADNTWTSNVTVKVDKAKGGVIKINGDDLIHIVWKKYEDSTYSVMHTSAMVGSATFATNIANNARNVQTISDSANLSLDFDSSNNPYISYSKGGDLYISSHTGTTWVHNEISDNVSNIYEPYIRLDSNDNILVTYLVADYMYSIRYDASGEVWGNEYAINEGALFASEFDASDNPILIDVKAGVVSIYPSTATYISEIYDTGFSTYTFQIFDADITSGDQDLAHYIRTATTSGGVASASWRSITSGNVVTAPVGQYIQYKVEFATNVLSNNLTSIEKIDINYRSSASTLHTASMLYDKRLWFAVAISSSIYNDRQLILDRNGAWTDFTSVHGCISLLNFNGTPYWGSDDGYIYTMDTGESDDGESIESWIMTKAYSMGSIIQQKTLDKVYVIADDSGNWNLTLDYYFDRSLTATNTFNIDLDKTANLINYKIPITKQMPFYTIQFKLSNNNANEPWDLLGIQVFGRMLPLR